MKTVTRAACRGCHGGCMYLLTVEDGRLVKAVPDPEGPLNQGRGCVKGMSIVEQVYHPDRLTTPLRRVGSGEAESGRASPGTRPWTRSRKKMGAIRDTYGPEALAIISGTGRTTWPSSGGLATYSARPTPPPPALLSAWDPGRTPATSPPATSPGWTTTGR